MLCDAQIENGRRRVILSSIVRIFNNTTLPLVIIDVADSIDRKKHQQIAKIDINKDFYIPIDLLYARSNSSIFISTDE